MKLTEKRTTNEFSNDRNGCAIKSLASFASKNPDLADGVEVQAFRKVSTKYGDNYIVYLPSHNVWVELPGWSTKAIDENIARGDIIADAVHNLALGWGTYQDRNNVERLKPVWHEIDANVNTALEF